MVNFKYATTRNWFFSGYFGVARNMSCWGSCVGSMRALGVGPLVLRFSGGLLGGFGFRSRSAGLFLSWLWGWFLNGG